MDTRTHDFLQGRWSALSCVLRGQRYLPVLDCGCRRSLALSARMLVAMPASQPPQPHTWQGIRRPRLTSLGNDLDTVATPLLSHRITAGLVGVHRCAEVRPRTLKYVVAPHRASLRCKPSRGLPTTQPPAPIPVSTRRRPRPRLPPSSEADHRRSCSFTFFPAVLITESY